MGAERRVSHAQTWERGPPSALAEFTLFHCYQLGSIPEGNTSKSQLQSSICIVITRTPEIRTVTTSITAPLSISANANVGTSSRVCARKTLHSAPYWRKERFSGNGACRVTFKYLPQSLKNHEKQRKITKRNTRPTAFYLHFYSTESLSCCIQRLTRLFRFNKADQIIL